MERERERDRETERETERQRDRETERQAGRRRWPDPSTLYFTPGIAEISKSKIKKKLK